MTKTFDEFREERGSLHVLGLGDSIVDDTMRSGWTSEDVAKLQPR